MTRKWKLVEPYVPTGSFIIIFHTLVALYVINSENSDWYREVCVCVYIGTGLYICKDDTPEERLVPRWTCCGCVSGSGSSEPNEAFHRLPQLIPHSTVTEQCVFWHGMRKRDIPKFPFWLLLLLLAVLTKSDTRREEKEAYFSFTCLNSCWAAQHPCVWYFTEFVVTIQQYKANLCTPLGWQTLCPVWPFLQRYLTISFHLFKVRLWI